MDRNSTILIAGGTGSIGSILTKRLLERGVREVRVLARDETRHQQLIDSLGRPSNLVSIIGDVRDKMSLDEAINGVDIVINAAAMKHVKYCEAYPAEAFKANVIGTQNLLELCLQKGVDNFVLASTDKAADPSTAYGASKFMAERLVVSAAVRNPGARFVAVRFGNVLGSRNSVLTRIRQLLDSGMPITVVKETMTRYVMTQSDAAELIVESLQYGTGGEIFTRNMPVVQVHDLIQAFVERYAQENHLNFDAVPVVEHEVQRGEKAHEALFSVHEQPRVRIKDRTLIIAPNDEHTTIGQPLEPQFVYTSELVRQLSKDEIRSLLDTARI